MERNYGAKCSKQLEIDKSPRPIPQKKIARMSDQTQQRETIKGTADCSLTSAVPLWLGYAI